MNHRFALAGRNRPPLAAALALPLLAAGLAHAQPDMESWSEMREEVVGAEEVLEGDVSNGLQPVSTVRDLVLNQDRDEVQYILMETPFPLLPFGGQDGFVAFDRAELQPGAGLNVDVVVDRDEPVSGPEDLELSGTEADTRLVSRLLDQRLQFPDGVSREVEDILIDRETGAVTHWVVETAEDAIFSTELRAIPADRISIEEGGVPSTVVELAALDDMQDYDPGLL